MSTLYWLLPVVSIFLHGVNGQIDYPLDCDGAVIAYTRDAPYGPGYHEAVPADVCMEYYSQTDSNYSYIYKCNNNTLEIWNFDDAHCKGEVTRITDFCEEELGKTWRLDCESYCGLGPCRYYKDRALEGELCNDEYLRPQVITQYNDYNVEVTGYCGYYPTFNGAFKYVHDGDHIYIHEFESDDCSGHPSDTYQWETIGSICQNNTWNTAIYSREYIFGCAIDGECMTTTPSPTPLPTQPPIESNNTAAMMTDAPTGIPTIPSEAPSAAPTGPTEPPTTAAPTGPTQPPTTAIPTTAMPINEPTVSPVIAVSGTHQTYTNYVVFMSFVLTLLSYY